MTGGKGATILWDRENRVFFQPEIKGGEKMLILLTISRRKEHCTQDMPPQVPPKTSKRRGILASPSHLTTKKKAQKRKKKKLPQQRPSHLIQKNNHILPKEKEGGWDKVNWREREKRKKFSFVFLGRGPRMAPRE